MLTPDDISGWFLELNPLVRLYLAPQSLGVFSLSSSKVRELCIACMLNKWFDRVILCSICLNALFLAADNPLNNDNKLVGHAIKQRVIFLLLSDF